MSSPAFSPNPEAVRAALAAVVASGGFRNSDRMIRFLRLVVERSLSGEDGGSVKEYTLGVEVFDRDPAFDPKTDTIVRVEARRLRRKLDEYYAGAGALDSIRIEMPGPGYLPVFTEIPTAVAAAAAIPETPVAAQSPVPIHRSRLPILAGLLAVLAAGTVGYWLLHRAPRVELTSVAVLPFANMSGDANQEYFSDGFTEEVIDRLSAIPDLRVAARTSSFQFKGKSIDIREIASRLNVDAVVEGSVRRAGDTVRITAQLIRASDGYHVWSRTWDRQGKGVLEVEADVAAAIAESYRLTLHPAHAIAPSLEAHDLYLLGRSHWHTLEPPDLFKAIGYFEHAIALAPDYALAYSGLSEVYSYLIDMDIVPTRDYAPKAKAAAEKAIALDAALAEAHTSLGLEKMDAEWDFTGAAKSFQRSLELKPRFAYGIHWQAHYLENRGQVDAGCAEMERAAQIDPLERIYRVDMAMCYYKQRRFDAAREQLRKVQELDPKWPLLDLTGAMILIARQNSAEALEAARRAETGIGAVPIALAVLAQAEALSGNKDAARTQVAKLRADARRAYVPAYALSLASYAAGDAGQGYHWLRRAWDDRNGVLVWLGRSPFFDQARKDPRAARLLAQVGNAAYTPE